jgi:hypothetical protein
LIPCHFNSINFIKCLVSAHHNKNSNEKKINTWILLYKLQNHRGKKKLRRNRLKSHTQSWMLLSPEFHRTGAVKTKTNKYRIPHANNSVFQQFSNPSDADTSQGTAKFTSLT